MHSALLVAKRNKHQITALLCPRKPAFDDTRSASPQYYGHSLRAQHYVRFHHPVIIQHHRLRERSILLSWMSSGPLSGLVVARKSPGCVGFSRRNELKKISARIAISLRLGLLTMRSDC